MAGKKEEKTRIKICLVKDCEASYHAKGYCLIHYMRVFFGKGRIDKVNQTTEGTCSEFDCDRPVLCKRLCLRHYHKFYRNRKKIA